MTDEFKKRLFEGRKSEDAVAFAFHARQVFTIPLANIANGGAPKMQGGPYQQAIILPDSQFFGEGVEGFSEVKGKSEKTRHRKTGIEEHGWGLRLHLEYLRFHRKTGKPFLIMVDEKESGEILAASLTKLGDPRVFIPRPGAPIPKGVDRDGMVYFPRDRFTVFHASDPTDCPLFKAGELPPTLPVCDLAHMASTPLWHWNEP
jgi:hypothetical protein